MCKIIGCTTCRPDQIHSCEMCDKNDHISIDCPYKKYRIATVTIFYKKSILVCRRGVEDKNFRKIYSQGGLIDENEKIRFGAVREAAEEAGIIIDPNELINVTSDYNRNNLLFINYAIIFNDLPIVNGPPLEFKDELLDINDICGIKTIINNDGVNTRLAWIPIETILTSGENSNFIRNLKNILIKLKI